MKDNQNNNLSSIYLNLSIFFRHKNKSPEWQFYFILDKYTKWNKYITVISIEFIEYQKFPNIKHNFIWKIIIHRAII